MTTLAETIDTSSRHASAGRRVVISLARCELPRLLKHPGTIMAVVFAAVLMGPWGSDPRTPVIEGLTWGLSLMVVPLAVTFALLGSRSVRDETIELETSTIGGTATPHTAALVLTAVAGLGVVVVGAAGGLIADIVSANEASMFSGPVVTESMLVLAQSAVAATAVACVALAAGSWLPHWITAALMVFAVLQGSDTPYHPNAWSLSAGTASLAWHAVYGVGVTLLAATVALARHRRDAFAAAVGAAGGLLALAGGIWQ